MLNLIICTSIPTKSTMLITNCVISQTKMLLSLYHAIVIYVTYWIGINCVANGAGLVALFVPGLNVPLMVFGVGGSILGVWGRIQSDKHIKEEFANIMSDIENHKDYSLISFSDLMKQKQNEFEEKRNRLMNHFGYNLNGANSVAIIEMIIDCMLTRRLFGPHERKGIKGEVTMDIVAQLKSTVSFLFERYGKHAFNFVDDTFELTLG